MPIDQLGIDSLKKILQDYKVQYNNTRLFDPMIELLENTNLDFIHNNIINRVDNLKKELNNISDGSFCQVKRFVNDSDFVISE